MAQRGLAPPAAHEDARRARAAALNGAQAAAHSTTCAGRGGAQRRCFVSGAAAADEKAPLPPLPQASLHVVRVPWRAVSPAGPAKALLTAHRPPQITKIQSEARINAPVIWGATLLLRRAAAGRVSSAGPSVVALIGKAAAFSPWPHLPMNFANYSDRKDLVPNAKLSTPQLVYCSV